MSCKQKTFCNTFVTHFVTPQPTENKRIKTHVNKIYKKV